MHTVSLGSRNKNCNHLCTPTYAHNRSIGYTYISALLYILAISSCPQGDHNKWKGIIIIHKSQMYNVKIQNIYNSS
jgi:hypothetical protein